MSDTINKSESAANSTRVVDLQQAKSAKSVGTAKKGSQGKASQGKASRGPKCPICGKPAQAAHKPFCSKRCADADLGKWLGEGYRIPTEEIPGFSEGYDGED